VTVLAFNLLGGDRAAVEPVPSDRRKDPDMARTRLASMALCAVAALVLAACGGPGAAGGGPTAQAAGSAADGIENPSDVKGGTLRFANSSDWDSLDPGDTYYTYAWNFARLYGRSLTVFKPAPSGQGATLVPDLAESLGTPSPDAKTWTYPAQRREVRGRLPYHQP